MKTKNFYFPKNFKEFATRFLTFENINTEAEEDFSYSFDDEEEKQNDTEQQKQQKDKTINNLKSSKLGLERKRRLNIFDSSYHSPDSEMISSDEKRKEEEKELTKNPLPQTINWTPITKNGRVVGYAAGKIENQG